MWLGRSCLEDAQQITHAIAHGDFVTSDDGEGVSKRPRHLLSVPVWRRAGHHSSDHENVVHRSFCAASCFVLSQVVERQLTNGSTDALKWSAMRHDEEAVARHRAWVGGECLSLTSLSISLACHTCITARGLELRAMASLRVVIAESNALNDQGSIVGATESMFASLAIGGAFVPVLRFLK
jgi:hypothetical protein